LFDNNAAQQNAAEDKAGKPSALAWKVFEMLKTMNLPFAISSFHTSE